MICENCGYNMNDDAVFCPSCGTRVSAEQNMELYKNTLENISIDGGKKKDDISHYPFF